MYTPTVAIIDGGGANIASLTFALDRIGATSFLTSDPAKISAASHVILPGVGAASSAMQKLNKYSLCPVIRDLQQPVLGICLGMQLLAASSDEDDTECTGIFSSTAKLLPVARGYPVPNMGWCRTQRIREHVLFDGIDDGAWFYYVHSYAIPINGSTVATASHMHGFSAVVSTHNFHATQFHPERSSAAGARLLQNFLTMKP